MTELAAALVYALGMALLFQRRIYYLCAVGLFAMVAPPALPLVPALWLPVEMVAMAWDFFFRRWSR